MKPHPSSSTVSAAYKLGVQRDSQVIGKLKFKPKIRIIHTIQPEIIKTESSNFRELVQRLTGKPADTKIHVQNSSSDPSKNDVSENGKHILDGNRVKKESEEIVGGGNSNGFMGRFGDVDGLIQDMIEFPLLPLKSSHHFSSYGGMPLFQ